MQVLVALINVTYSLWLIIMNEVLNGLQLILLNLCVT